MWKMLGQYQPYSVSTKWCLLCLNEKLQITIYRGNNMLNKRTEIINKCRHRRKCALARFDSMDRNIRCKVSCDDWKFLRLLGVWFTVIVKQIHRSFIYFNKFHKYMYFMWRYSTHAFTIINVDTFHGSKADFPVTSVVTSFKIRTKYKIIIL